jgi:hypothetical protein
MTAREKPLHLQTVQFCRYHLGKHCFGPFTGQDIPAWNSFVYLLQCYSHGGGELAIDAMRAVVRCAQPSKVILEVFVQAIPGVLDWGDVAKLWPEVAHGLSVAGQPAYTLQAVERSEVYRKASNAVEVTTRRHGWQAPEQLAAAGGAR